MCRESKMNAIVNYDESDSEEDILKEGTACGNKQNSSNLNSNTLTDSVDYFNLETSSEEEQELNERDSVPDEIPQQKIERTPCEDWTKSINVSNKRTTAHSSSEKGTLKTKRLKLENSNADLAANKQESINAKCFTVHPRIMPRLSNQGSVLNKLPTRKLCELPGHRSAANRIYWCRPQFSHLLLSSSLDSTVKVWDIFRSDQQCVRQISSHRKGVKDALWSLCGRQVVSGGFDMTACITDVETGQELYSCAHQSHVSCIKTHPADSNLFLVGCKDIILAWDKRDDSKPARRFTYKDKFGQVLDLCFMNEVGEQFLSSSDLVTRDTSDRNIMIWDFSTSAILSGPIFQERYTCTRLLVHPTENRFIAQTQGDYIALFSSLPPYRLDKCKRFEGHKVSGYDVGCDISPDGKFVCSGSADGQMMFYKFHLAKPLGRLKVEDGLDPVLSVAWHPLLYSTVACSTWTGRLLVYQ